MRLISTIQNPADPQLNFKPPVQRQILFLGLAAVMVFRLITVRAEDAVVFDPEAALRGLNFDPALTDENGEGDGRNNPGTFPDRRRHG